MIIKDLKRNTNNIEIGFDLKTDLDIDFYLLMLNEDNIYKKEDMICYKNKNSSCGSIICNSDDSLITNITDNFKININKIPLETRRIIIIASPFRTNFIEETVSVKTFLKYDDSDYTLINVSDTKISSKNNCFQTIELLRNDKDEWFYCLKDENEINKYKFKDLDSALNFYERKNNSNIISITGEFKEEPIKIKEISKKTEIKLNF